MKDEENSVFEGRKAKRAEPFMVEMVEGAVCTQRDQNGGDAKGTT